MSLTSRKVVVISLIAGVFLAGNLLVIVQWLADKGVPETAQWIRSEFLTGNAIAVILAMLILLVNPARGVVSVSRRSCPVCAHGLTTKGSYCPECGSKISLA
ncbi:hypothetical protein ACFL6U_17460 [Planctomycetota bacterium]